MVGHSTTSTSLKGGSSGNRGRRGQEDRQGGSHGFHEEKLKNRGYVRGYVRGCVVGYRARPPARLG
jgi:hypothetical protein